MATDFDGALGKWGMFPDRDWLRVRSCTGPRLDRETGKHCCGVQPPFENGVELPEAPLY